jgi:hypothetical protein
VTSISSLSGNVIKSSDFAPAGHRVYRKWQSGGITAPAEPRKIYHQVNQSIQKGKAHYKAVQIQIVNISEKMCLPLA